MKAFKFAKAHTSHHVAPLVGAWIERCKIKLHFLLDRVAPLVGAWIERYAKSPQKFDLIVAPLVGAWIESTYLIMFPGCISRSLLL